MRNGNGENPGKSLRLEADEDVQVRRWADQHSRIRTADWDEAAGGQPLGLYRAFGRYIFALMAQNSKSYR